MSVTQEKEYEYKGVRIVPFFSTEFYRYYAEKPTLAEANDYIAALGREYLSILQLVVAERFSSAEGIGKRSKGHVEAGELLILYPAVQWMHLMALHYALQKISGKACGLQLEHRLCLMYNPGRDHTGEVVNISEWLSYRLACKALAQYENVKLYASDYELADHYGHLLELNAPMPLHPHYLAVNGELQHRQVTGNSGKVVGLYFGDAKVEKGFTRLPELIKKLLPVIGDNDQLVVQYVSQGNCPRILATQEALKNIAVDDVRIKLICDYLPASHMQRILASLDVYVFAYDVMHYRNKSSGFLWLLANESCKLIFLGESWLSREARRLRINAHTCSAQDLPEALLRILAHVGLGSRE